MENQNKKKTKKKKAGGMTGPVWGRRIGGAPGEANVAYCAGWDVREREAADLRLLPYDLWTNRAHCVMLARAGVIPPAKLRKILKALDKLEALAQNGRYKLDPKLEDVHLNVESFVEAEAGPAAAGLMHTARSRNDQVATDMRLYLRDRVLQFAGEAALLAECLVGMARKQAATVMPGLTHHQPAAWTTFGHWAASHASAFARDIRSLLDLLPMMNVSPLGAAASFGSSWPVDRRYAARLLAFDALQVNTLDCITNRSEFDARAAGLLAVWAAHAATLCQDLILFSSPPWSLLRIGDAFVTGSSIMPQKRNPDFAEVTKAKAALAGSIAGTLLDLTRGDPSGYNREQQWSKYLLFDLFSELEDAPAVIRGALESLSLDKKRMRGLMREDYLEAADIADYLAQTRKVPFRETYRWMGEAVRRSEEDGTALPDAVNAVLAEKKRVRALDGEERRNLTSPDYLIARRRAEGGPAPDSVRKQCADLKKVLGDLKRRTRQHTSAIERGRRRLESEMKRHAS